MRVGAVAMEVHRDLDVICGLVLCQGYYQKGQEHPLDKQVQDFLAEKDDTEFEEPKGTTGVYKETSRVDVEGLIATKVVERQYFMDGSSNSNSISTTVRGTAKPGKSLTRTLLLD